MGARMSLAPTWWGSIGCRSGRPKAPPRFTLHAALSRRSPRTFCGLEIFVHSNKPGGFRICGSCLYIAQRRQQRARLAPTEPKEP